MTYRVIVLPKAEVQLYRNALWWADHRSLEQSLRWADGFEVAIKSLAENPDKHSLARENESLPITVRQLLYGLGNKPTHRAVFEVRDEIVYVHAVRHLAQRDLTSEDL